MPSTSDWLRLTRWPKTRASARRFSLMRTSSLRPSDYLSTYFDTGMELQTDHEARPTD